MRALFLALLLPFQAQAAELAGVTLPDTITLGDATLQLNGLGLREFMWIDVYVGGLYLPEKTSDAAKAIQADAPKRIVMHFIYRKVGRSKVLDTFRDGFAKVPGGDQLQAELAQLETFIDRDVVSGDQVVLDYVPGKGTSVAINGQVRGTIGGAPFMKGLWGIFLGDAPASAKLKAGMLGGG